MFRPIGYVVLRRPRDNFVSGDMIGHKQAPTAFGRCYSGIDRMLWSDFDELHYESKLSAEEDVLWRELRNHRHARLTDLSVLDSIDAAETVMELLGEKRLVNEICCVDGLEFGEGLSRPGIASEKIKWIGSDIHVSGYGSPLAQGLYVRPDLFVGFSESLNEHGLFPDDEGLLQDYKVTYMRIATINNLEVMPETMSLWRIVRVGRPG